MLHVEPTPNSDEKGNFFLEEAKTWKNEESKSFYEKILTVEENQIDTSRTLMCLNIDKDKEVVEETFQTEEIPFSLG